MQVTEKDIEFIEVISRKCVEIENIKEDVKYGFIDKIMEISKLQLSVYLGEKGIKIKKIVTKIMNDSGMKTQMMDLLVQSNLISKNIKEYIEEKQLPTNKQATDLIGILRSKFLSEDLDPLSRFIAVIRQTIASKKELEQTKPKSEQVQIEKNRFFNATTTAATNITSDSISNLNDERQIITPTL